MLKLGIFAVRLVKVGETFGPKKVVNDKFAMLEFYDRRMRAQGEKHGRYITRIPLRCLFFPATYTGIQLDARVEEWALNYEDMCALRKFISRKSAV